VSEAHSLRFMDEAQSVPQCHEHTIYERSAVPRRRWQKKESANPEWDTVLGKDPLNQQPAAMWDVQSPHMQRMLHSAMRQSWCWVARAEPTFLKQKTHSYMRTPGTTN